MSEQEIRNNLKRAFAAAEVQPPSFDQVLANAEAARARSRRYRLSGGIAAAVAVAAVIAALWPTQQEELTDDYLIADSLLNSTSWPAPSDTLMPERQFDIYQELPLLMESTQTREGSLL